MRQVNVNKDRLIGILIVNRAEHRELFLDAQEKYRALVIKVLDQELARARKKNGPNMSRITKIVVPQDYTSYYDRALHMLRMSTDDIVSITADEFRQYVEDDWDWGRQWALANSSYSSSPKMSRYLDH